MRLEPFDIVVMHMQSQLILASLETRFEIIEDAGETSISIGQLRLGTGLELTDL